MSAPSAGNDVRIKREAAGGDDDRHAGHQSNGSRIRESPAPGARPGPGRDPNASKRATAALAMATARRAARLHVIELLAPVDPTIHHHRGQTTAHAVALQRTADDWLEIVFPGLSLPGKMVTRSVECVNHASGCRCDFARLLRTVMVLMERQILRVTMKYVISDAAGPMGGEGAMTPTTTTFATIQVIVQIHERVGRTSVSSLEGFDLVLSHLQSGLKPVKIPSAESMGWGALLVQAKQSKCHVVGCELHPLDSTNMPTTRTLREIFQSLTSQVDVGRMAIRDDETYVARMKRARKEVVLTDLPISALHTVVRMANARDLASLSSVCSMFQHLAYEVVPGLKLLLYTHQRKALKWMLYREGSMRVSLTALPHPFMFPSILPVSGANPQDEDHLSKVIDLLDERLVKRSAMTPAVDVRGGLFCDEPGLGKTITMLALILRTKGQQTKPSQDPAGHLSPGNTIGLRSGSKRGRTLEFDKLESSVASLIIVPNPLLEHWRYQIDTHLNEGSLRVFVDDVEFKSQLPSPEELATYDVVITSFGRLTHEWKFHRPTSALEERRPDRYGFEDAPQRFVDGYASKGTSSLLMVHWVRIIVDEGHKIGGTNPTYHMRMARLLHADKRWVMTGTPTPTRFDSADLRHMHGLLVFLRDRPYGDVDGKLWTKAIARPFEHGDRAGYIRLQHLLSRIMMRHTKESVQTVIPKPVRRTVLIHPTPREYAIYNGVAAAARANIVITNIDPKEPGMKHPDSLLNPIHSREAMRVAHNLRAATCAGNKIRAELTRKSFSETINMLNDANVDSERIAEITKFMRSASDIEFLTQCKTCKRHLQLLMLIPCGHMACADCVETRINSVGPNCGICEASYDREVFQMLQPGFEFKHDVFDLEYEENGGGDNAVGARRHNGQQEVDERRRGRNNRNTITIPERDGNRQRRRPLDIAKFAPVNSSKAFYVARRILELKDEFKHSQRLQLSESWLRQSQRPKLFKAIIFSQFKEHIWRVKVALAQQGIRCSDFISGVTPGVRMASLHKFRLDPSSNVLLMTDIGSHGLDLSFVTHIFLMDEIWDKSLEQQVISRAHRMGARHSVIVEQLLMRGSLEEQLHNNQYPDDPAAIQEDDELVAASSGRAKHKSNTRAAAGFFAGEKKKRGKGKQPAGLNEGAKSSAQRIRLRRLLSNLRLLPEAIVADFGYVRFSVQDETGRVIREENFRLPRPGPPPRVPLSGGNSTNTQPQSASLSNTTTTTSVVPSQDNTVDLSRLPERSSSGQSLPNVKQEPRSGTVQRPAARQSPPHPKKTPTKTKAPRQVNFASVVMSTPVPKVKVEQVSSKGKDKAKANAATPASSTTTTLVTNVKVEPAARPSANTDTTIASGKVKASKAKALVTPVAKVKVEEQTARPPVTPKSNGKAKAKAQATTSRQNHGIIDLTSDGDESTSGAPRISWKCPGGPRIVDTDTESEEDWISGDSTDDEWRHGDE